jgi:hypothetical protein
MLLSSFVSVISYLFLSADVLSEVGHDKTDGMGAAIFIRVIQDA